MVHGLTGYSEHCETHAKYTFRFAKKCFKALSSRFPDQIPVNCIGLSDKITDKPYEAYPQEPMTEKEKKGHKRVVKFLKSLKEKE